MSTTEKTPSRILMDWMEANNVRLYGATPAMLVSVLESQAGYGKLAEAWDRGMRDMTKLMAAGPGYEMGNPYRSKRS